MRIASIIKRLLEYRRMHFRFIKTVWFNFKVFDFKVALKLPVLLFGRVQTEGLYKGCIELQSIKRGGVKIGGGRYTYIFGHSDRRVTYLCIKGKLIVGTDVCVMQGAVISICKNAVVSFGNNVFFNEGIILHSKLRIKIDDDCRMGWNVQIIDSSFHYIIKNGTLSYPHSPVFIGRNVWVANGVTILKGTNLPPHSIVCSGSLVNKNFSVNNQHCMIAGVPAKVVAKGVEQLYVNEEKVDQLFHDSEPEIDWEVVKEEIKKEKYQLLKWPEL